MAVGEQDKVGAAGVGSEGLGALLVFMSAFVWSLGGAIARFLTVEDSWTIVFWRSFWAVAFLIAFMLWRDGRRGTVALFREMGWAGLAVGVCFAVASTSFVVALSFTTVANILLIGASVPLLAALLGWLVFRERVAATTWAAIAVVIAGVAIMVSDSVGGSVSPIGDGLAVMIAVSFAIATVISRHNAHVRMTPAVCVGAGLAGLLALTQAATLAVVPADLGLLFLFGALNLGLGMALFTSGVRMIPAAFAALLGTAETMLGPFWVWLVHDEVPSSRTIVGGAIILTALVAHILVQMKGQRRARPAALGVSPPH